MNTKLTIHVENVDCFARGAVLNSVIKETIFASFFFILTLDFIDLRFTPILIAVIAAISLLTAV